MKKSYKLIWDECNPTADRRPTTNKDIENDIHVEYFDTEEELLKALMEIADVEESDLEETNIDERIKEITLDVLDDTGDGSPNIIYIEHNNKDPEEDAYSDILPDDFLADASEEEVKQALCDYYRDLYGDLFDSDFESTASEDEIRRAHMDYYRRASEKFAK